MNRPSKLHGRISSSPGIYGGRPIFAGMRMPVHQIVAAVRRGETDDEIQENHPLVEDADLATARLISIVIDELAKEANQ